jgi:hypothetical protein
MYYMYMNRKSALNLNSCIPHEALKSHVPPASERLTIGKEVRMDGKWSVREEEQVSLL